MDIVAREISVEHVHELLETASALTQPADEATLRGILESGHRLSMVQGLLSLALDEVEFLMVLAENPADERDQ